MDPEYQVIIKTIFKDSFPEQWKENPDFSAYLDELASYGVSKLSKEPERLSEERAAILEQTQDLAFHNYKTFIQTAECSQEIFQDFNLVEQHLDSLLTKLPSFMKSCEDFTKKSQEISSSRRVNSLSLQKHPQLLEILELPQLMDTCVRNGYYEEALELTSYVRRLGKKHSNIPIIMNIVTDVQDSNLLMLNQLLNQLRSNIQLPACLKVIGFLRRMNVFSEAELRIKFLQSRDVWFENILSTIPNDDAYHHLNKTIEISRVHLFDIITQYRAIFSDDDPLLSTGRDNPDINEASIFHGWILGKVKQFVKTLENDLHKGVSQGILGRLDSILGQAMYFGLSFSRVGVDFRGVIAPIFEKTAVNGFLKCAENAAKKFTDSMEAFTLTSLPSVLPPSYGPSANMECLVPPNSLIEFHPLASFCNKILMGFNDLRLCCPLSAAQVISRCLQMSCRSVVKTIVDFHRAEETALTEAECKAFTRMCRVVVDDLVPFLDRCLNSLFPASQLSEVLGCSMSKVDSMKFVGSLDKPEIASSLSPFLPAEEDVGIILKIDGKQVTPNETASDSVGDDRQKEVDRMEAFPRAELSDEPIVEVSSPAPDDDGDDSEQPEPATDGPETSSDVVESNVETQVVSDDAKVEESGVGDEVGGGVAETS